MCMLSSAADLRVFFFFFSLCFILTDLLCVSVDECNSGLILAAVGGEKSEPCQQLNTQNQKFCQAVWT